MTLTKLEPAARVGDQVFDAIHDAIMSGEFPAGHRLRIRQLADELGTSVMPVREAIKRLEEVGVVESLPYRGAVVKELTADELLQIYAVRRLLEVEAARAGVSAPARTDAGLDQCRAAMSEALDRRDEVGYIDADEAFLTAVYAQGGNQVLLETIRALWVRCRTYKIMGVRRELAAGSAQRLLDFQDELMVAARAGDSLRAASLTAASLDAATDRIKLALRPSGTAPAYLELTMDAPEDGA